jgi:hypothetical protein
VIIRDEKGLVSAKPYTNRPRLKAVAALHAEELCRDLGVQEKFVEEDSMVVSDIKIVLKTCRKWSVCHVIREANGVEHRLAREALRTLIDKIWIDE